FRDFGAATEAPELVTGFAFNGDGIMYVGATAPRMGVFVIDTGGAPRVAVGPIARAFETDQALADGRLDPEAVKHAAVREPWAASYTVPDTSKAPPVQVEMENTDPLTFVATAKQDIGPLTLELLD